jgi:4-hydroxy-3-polyprenylbenzoate decarboxylase
MYRDLREFLARIEELGELVRFSDYVSLDLELAAVLRELMYSGGPVVIFERIREGTLPAVGNVFGSWRRILEAVGMDPLEAASRIGELLMVKPPQSIGDLVKSLGELKRIGDYFPRVVKGGSVRETQWDVKDITRLPAIRQWPLEPGRFLTYGETFVRFGEYRNFGYYRLQVIGRDRLIMHWMPWRRSLMYGEEGLRSGDGIDVAVVFGPEPVAMLMGGIPIPHPLDKLLVTGVIRGGGIELTRGVTVDVEYPAHAELVIEGRVTASRAREGPYGDHVGVYSIAKDYPIMEVTGIYSRREPVVPVTVTGKPVLEDGYIIRFGERIILPMLRQLVPELVDIRIPPEGIGYVTLVSIRKRYPGHGKRIMVMLWGLVPLLGKVLIVLDHDVELRDWGSVLYHVATHVDPRRDVLVLPEYPTEELDPSTPVPSLGGKLGIDATRKLPEEYGGKEYPQDLDVPREIGERAVELAGKIRSLMKLK